MACPVIDLVTIARKVTRRGRREVTALVLDTAYRVDRFHQGRYLPPLDGLGRRVLDVLQGGDIAVRPLDEFKLASTPAMESAAESIFAAMGKDLEDGSGTSGEPIIRMSSDVPELRAWATERRLMAIVGNYLGVPGTFQGVHARIERMNAEQVTSEQWHRDLEDRRMLKIFYFPETVTIEHGPYEYVRDSDLGPDGLKVMRRAAKDALRRNQMGLTDHEMAEHVDRKLWRTSEVPARSLVFADPTAAYHHGRLRTLPRPSLFFVYTSAFPRHPEYCKQYWNDRYPPA